MTDPGGWGDEWDDVADVVVIGTGVAGMAAGLASASRGCSVIFVERAPFVGGTTAKSGGSMWIPNNRLMRDAGLVDERSQALEYLAKVAYPAHYDASAPHLGLPELKYRLLEAFYDNGSVAFDELADLGAIPFDAQSVELGYPDYHADLPEDAAPLGRTIRVRLPDGHQRGLDPTGGEQLVEQMRKVAEGQGSKFLLDTRVVHVVRNGEDEVVGVEARTGQRTVLIGAQHGVVFATGGFLHDEGLRFDFVRGRLFGGAAGAGSTGDFVRIGAEVGAQLGNMTEAWWDEVALESVLRTPSTIEDVWSPFGDSMMIVNRYGRRVMNEKLPYSERGPVHFNWDVDRSEHPNLLLFMVYDDAVAQNAEPSATRHPVPMPGEPDDHVITADSWLELAGAIEARLGELAPHIGGFQVAETFLDGLLAAVERFDALAAAGTDLDHHRGESLIERKWASQPRPGSNNPFLHPFAAQGPFHCIVLAAGALDTKGGPVIDGRAQVLSVDGSPIPGLFGAGNCIASPAGRGYWGPGGTIGPALTFGYLAGVSAASGPMRLPTQEPEFQGSS
ncbi:MAG: hypothetical protein JWL73_2860 [Actinomycetia bacterium]|nr:hypothetical protein [Actinomycetes bacterium]